MKTMTLCAAALILTSGLASAQADRIESVDAREAPTTAVGTARVGEPAHVESSLAINHVSYIEFSPALTSARLELRAGIQNWTCSALTPRLRECRQRIDAVMQPEDRLALDAIRTRMIPLLKIMFLEQEQARIAREGSDVAALSRHEENLHLLKMSMAEAFGESADLFVKYSDQFSAIFEDLVGPRATWIDEVTKMTERWQNANAERFDRDEQRYIVGQCFLDHVSKLSAMVLYLPFLDDCDLDDPALMFPDVNSGGHLDLK